MRPFLPFATLLGAVFLLGCQDLGPTTPEAQPTVLMEASIVPATAFGSGTVVSINAAEKHGAIRRENDGSNNLYQFNIPRDLGGPTIPDVGDFVVFAIDPENSRHATNIFVPCIPPDCGGG